MQCYMCILLINMKVMCILVGVFVSIILSLLTYQPQSIHVKNAKANYSKDGNLSPGQSSLLDRWEPSLQFI